MERAIPVPRGSRPESIDISTGWLYDMGEDAKSTVNNFYRL